MYLLVWFWFISASLFDGKWPTFCPLFKICAISTVDTLGVYIMEAHYWHYIRLMLLHFDWEFDAAIRFGAIWLKTLFVVYPIAPVSKTLSLLLVLHLSPMWHTWCRFLDIWLSAYTCTSVQLHQFYWVLNFNLNQLTRLQVSMSCKNSSISRGGWIYKLISSIIKCHFQDFSVENL